MKAPTDPLSPAPTDVLVIGGGPAGSSAAIVLAERGRSVVQLEKSHHPRFHIGESLLPANLPIFERLGVAEQVKAIGMQKWGAEFVSPWHGGRGETFNFTEGWNKSLPFAYQVRRSEFDEILIRRSQQQGTQLFEGCRARRVERQSDGQMLVEAEDDDGTPRAWLARYVIDASGRDTLLGNQLGNKRRNSKHNSAALYGHFRHAERYPEEKRAGNISIYWFEHGWFWFIPLADGVTSIGAVVWPYYLKSRKVPVRDFFLDTIALCPSLAMRLKNAELVAEPEATGNYAYSCAASYGPGYLLAGDAFSFIDPMFSSGVLMAMVTGIAGAEAVDECLSQPQQYTKAMKEFDRIVRHGPNEYSWFIYRITNPTMRDLFMAPRNDFRMKEAMLGLLAGDIYGDTPIWKSLRAFKGIYYVFSTLSLKRSLLAMRRRAANIRPTEPERAAAG
ncbi:MAG: tryptophan 7-halogenase [Proteobacteria bacterium]|nr:tryptophan 7-halogenase [Pseudomonadota bacterium]